MRSLLLAALFALHVAAACAGPSGDEASIVREARGDTVLVTIPAGYDTAAARVDSLEVLWQDPALNQPRAMALLGSKLIVGDRTQVHLIDVRDQAVTSVGRAGRGPEEFARVLGVGAEGTQVAVFDIGNARLAILDSTGAFVGTRRVDWPGSFVNVRVDGSPYRFREAGLLIPTDGVMRRGEVSQSALIWQPLVEGTPEVVMTWPGITVLASGGYITSTRAFPPQALFAVSKDGRVAASDGLEYCITISAIAGPDVRRVCRLRPRTRVTAGVHRGVPEELDLDPSYRAALEELVAAQSIGEFFPSLDRVLFAETGEVWVRVLGSDAPDLHPLVSYLEPSAWPTHRRWESLDPEGSPSRSVLLPRSFEPHLFAGPTAYGLLSLESGEVVVARAQLDAF